MSSTPRLLERLQSWTPLFLLLLLLAATWWLNEQVKPLAPVEDPRKRHDVDYVIDGLSSIALNAQGQPRYVMSAESMWHYPDDDTAHLKRPVLTNLSPDRAPFNFSSDTAKLSHNGEELFMYDDVVAVRPADAKRSEMTFHTDYLHVLPDPEKADTDHPVTIVDAHNTVHAVGMEMDNKTHIIKLLSRVRSRHEPAHAQ